MFPPPAEVLLLRDVSGERFIERYNEQRFTDIVYLSTYRDPIIQAAIKACKFHRSERAAKLLGLLFMQWLNKQSKHYLIVPIPLSNERKRERGYNQVERILKTTDVTMHTSLLQKSIHTPPQTSLSKAERTENLHGSFSVTTSSNIKGQHILLVDDVVTTGSTFAAARAALAPHSPASITCLALAH
ncbi:MAG: phosphoribosyltransferase family protein [Patescibacteria group bacterium]